jgi:hypothetical protein
MMTRNPRWTNSYRLQYWLYAVLNYEFGTEVKFERDSLHARYSVNRHGFDVISNTTSSSAVRSQLIRSLERSGYTIAPTSTRDFLVMHKKTDRGVKVEDLYVSVRIATKNKLSINGSSYLK